MLQQLDVSQQVREQSVATLECDVPDGWSLDEWRTVRGLAREVTTEDRPRWGVLRRAWRRPRD
jgi:hypothetical protein